MRACLSGVGWGSPVLLATMAMAQDIVANCVVPSANTLTSSCYGACNETSANSTTASCLVFGAKDTATGCANQKPGLCHEGVGPNKCKVLCLVQPADAWTYLVGVADPNSANVADIKRIDSLVLPPTVTSLRLLPRDKVDNPSTTIDVSATSIKRAPGLRSLSVEQLFVPNISALTIFPNITSLQLKQVKLSPDEFNNILHVESIETLNLANNNLATIPGNVFGMKSLKQLDISMNPLQSVLLSSSDEKFLRNLATLTATGSPSMPCPSNTAPKNVQGLQYCMSSSTVAPSDPLHMIESTTTAPAPTPSPSETSRGYAFYLFIGLGCLAVLGVGVYLLLFRSKRAASRAKKNQATNRQASVHVDDDLQGATDTATFQPCASVRPSSALLTARSSLSAAALSMRSLHHEIAARDVDVSAHAVVFKHNRFDMLLAKVRGSPVYLNRVLPLTQDKALSLLSMLSTLRHPRLMNVVGVVWRSVDVGVQMDVALEFLDSGTLESVLLLGHRSLSWHSGKRQMALEVALALLQVHEHDFVYHGLTGKTVFVDSAQGCKLHTLALVDDSAIDDDQSRTEDRIFLAPEVLTGCAISSATDMYAFGVLLMLLDAAVTPWQLSRRTWIQTASDPSAAFPDEVDITSLLGLYAFDTCPAIIKAVAKSCVHPDPMQRPSASFAYAMMRKDLVG
ncbi:serine/threonine protein kinase [Saprolegnia diclina VS20]|uniref:Serine/threonine protein kinase n=1 Tax=Saprolegnia diclina (strain VS20) TaxID=1156394 RepID=T0R180_SAPDV|nr:serine/threonine protein kinase [Saprolegnia diclina VS20]EQC40055.1 serine/threonine protein kinase [Saprolegnia diclina VS20]|eukprot:XP_008606529.1 serine/threonine protein kinase [Saprolegnia diclina VS20]